MGIGPSTKETSLHHFRDPLLEVVSSDPEIDLMGVIIVGTPDADEEKHLVGTRAAVWAECMRADGAIVSRRLGQQRRGLYQHRIPAWHSGHTRHRA